MMTSKQLERLSDLLGRFYEEVDEGEGQIRYEIGVVRDRVESILDQRVRDHLRYMTRTPVRERVRRR